jgi:Insertion element 4 transposase N-terminal
MAPAAPIELPSPPSITDRIALGALTSTFPPELVDEVVAQTGRAQQRRRLLPARVVVYFVLALALYSHAAYEEVMRCLVEGLGWAVGARRGRRTWPYWHVPGASALAEARERLGLSRCGCCSPRPPGRWRPRPPGVGGIASGG